MTGERSGADEGLHLHRTLELGAVELDDLLLRALGRGLGRPPLDGGLVAALHREHGGPDLEAHDRELATRLLHHLFRLLVRELGRVEVLGLVLHEPVLDGRRLVGVGLALLVLLGLLAVELGLLVHLGLVAAGDELLLARVQRLLLHLEIRLVAHEADETERRGLGPRRADHLEVAQVEGVRLRGLVLGTGLDDVRLDELREALLREARLELGEHEVAVADDVVRPEDLLVLRLRVGDHLALLVTRQDLDVLDRAQREVEAIVRADHVEHLERALAVALEHRRIDLELPTALVGALGDEEDRALVLDEEAEHVEHAVVGTHGLEAGADEALAVREDAPHHVLRLARLAVGVGAAHLLRETGVAGDVEVLGRRGVLPGEHRLRGVRADERRLVVVVHLLERDLLAERLAVDASLDREGLGVLRRLEEERRLALVEGRRREVAAVGQADLRRHAHEARDLARVGLEAHVDRATHRLLEGVADRLDRDAEVLDLAHVAVQAVLARVVHERREEAGVVPVAVADHREAGTRVGDRLGGRRGLALLLLQLPLGGHGAAVREEDRHVLGVVGDLLNRLERELERLREHGRVEDADLLLDGLDDHLPTLLVAARRTGDRLGAAVAAEDDHRCEVVLAELGDELLGVLADVVDDRAHGTRAVDDHREVLVALLLLGLDAELEEDAVLVDLRDGTGARDRDVHVGPLFCCVGTLSFGHQWTKDPLSPEGGINNKNYIMRQAPIPSLACPFPNHFPIYASTSNFRSQPLRFM